MEPTLPGRVTTMSGAVALASEQIAAPSASTHGPRDRRRLQGRAPDQAPGHKSDVAHARALCAEVLGTFVLTTIGAGMEVVPAAMHSPVNEVLHWSAPGMIVMAMIYSLGDVSGAHINPVVTLSFALRGAFRWRYVPEYWACQLLGAVLAAELLRAIFGLAGHLGTTRPHTGSGTALVIEILLTVFLVLVILATADGSRLVGHNAGIAVGATIVVDGFFGGPVSGASMNPARSLGPALVSGTLSDVWIYVIGPTVGALFAVALIRILRGPPPAHEAEAATGQQVEGGR